MYVMYDNKYFHDTIMLTFNNKHSLGPVPALAVLRETGEPIIIIKFIQDMYSTTVHKYNTRTKFLNLTCH